MNIALFGYGKMGKMLETLGTKRGHTIAAKVDLDNQLSALEASAIDVAIDFSAPSAALENIKFCLTHHIPVVSGTTGWLDHYEEAVQFCKAQQGAFLYASNFSLGVNIFFELNRRLAQMMQERKDYRVAIEEIHHVHKLDAPSGTAISLAEGIIENSEYEGWGLTPNAAANELPITALREYEVPGTHTIDYASSVDQITIKHTAHNRHGFALGALIAAEWIRDRKGVFTMKDVLNLA
ncbi:MAG: 4-hydroxy-tetrahydrodipicolinate reductase [Bacteroidota bacterium]